MWKIQIFIQKWCQCIWQGNNCIAGENIQYHQNVPNTVLCFEEMAQLVVCMDTASMGIFSNPCNVLELSLKENMVI